MKKFFDILGKILFVLIILGILYATYYFYSKYYFDDFIKAQVEVSGTDFYREDKNFCLEYMKNVDEYGILERDSASFLMEFYPWMRLARIALNMHEETMLLVFNSLHASLKQKNLIHELQDKKLLLNRFLKDMND